MPELLEVTLVQNYFSQQIINRFNYIANGTPASVSLSYGLVYAMGAIPELNVYDTNKLMSKISTIQAETVSFQGITALNVYSDTDFYSTGFFPALVGASQAEAMSPVLSIGYRTTRVRRDIRRGTKRFTGIPELLIGDGGVIDTNNEFIEGLRVGLGEVLTYDDEGNTLTYTPCVVKKQKYFVNDDPERVAYRYIPVADGGKDAQLLDTASGFAWETYATARTQNSRQYGRGI